MKCYGRFCENGNRKKLKKKTVKKDNLPTRERVSDGKRSEPNQNNCLIIFKCQNRQIFSFISCEVLSLIKTINSVLSAHGGGELGGERV